MKKQIRFVPPKHPKGVESIPISLGEIQSEAWYLAQELQQRYPHVTDAIIITTGALTVSHMLFAFLRQMRRKEEDEMARAEVDNIETFGVRSYRDDHSRGAIKVVKPPGAEWISSVGSRKIFVIDEVSESGGTTKFVKSYLRRRGIRDAVYISVVVKPQGKPAPDHFGMEVANQGLWCDFFWNWEPEEETGPPIIEKF